MMRSTCLWVLLIAAACHDNTSNNGKDMAMNINNDLGGDASACTEGAACALAGGAKGLCQAGACAACHDSTDDLACETAYGEPNKSFICASGCVEGCRTDRDCGGQLCGVTTPNVCGPCTTDMQCGSTLGTGLVCEISSGKCISASCPAAGSACAANSADICCAVTAGNSCFAGNCCSNSDCGDAGKSCVNHSCTNCPSPAPGVLVVDPSESAGGEPTGADVAGCRFKTITAALQVATPGTTVQVLGTQDITGANTCTDKTIECFPIAVNAGISVIGDAAQPPTIRQTTAGPAAFTLSGASSSLSNLTIDGAPKGGAATGSIGIRAAGASPSPTPAPQIDHVNVQNFTFEGIDLVNSILDVNAGVTLTKNQKGLLIESAGTLLRIKGGADPISFSKNSSYGLEVDAGACIATGTPGTGGVGNVVFNENGVTGLYIFATPGSTDASKVTLTGVVAWKNTGDGVQISPGTPVKIRGSYILDNTASGIHILSGGVDASDNLIDLGTASSAGGNTLQASANSNGGAGICMDSIGTVEAEGNIFSGPIDCSVAAAGNIHKNASACTTPAAGPITDVGYTHGTLITTNCGQN